jgi:hypothetical protein
MCNETNCNNSPTEAIEATVKATIKIMAEDLRRIKISSPLKSPSHWAQIILTSLGYSSIADIPLFTTIHQPCDDVSVLVPQGDFVDEYHFNSAFHEEFVRMFGADRLFNTERYPYLLASDYCPKHSVKPDWLIFEIGSVLTRKPKPSDQYGQEQIKYAVPSEDWLPFITGIMEGKVGSGNLTLTDLEAILRYLSILNKTGHENARGILYNQREFIYAEYSVLTGGVSTIVRGEWAIPGCSTFLRQKFKPPSVMKSLIDILEAESLALVRFLGQGRFGRVVEVQRNDGDSVVNFALKFVMQHPDKLESEFSALCRFHTAASEFLIAPVENSFRQGEGDLAWYLMSEVGNPEVELAARSVFLLLHSLHKQGIAHGDPRIANIVIVKGKLKWVDPREMCDLFSLAEAARADIRAVIKSTMYLTDDVFERFPALLSKINAYTSEISEKNIVAVYEFCKSIIS